GDALIEEAKKWIQVGGMCDFTADAEVLNETATVETLNKFRAEKLPLKQISVSSDAYGPLEISFIHPETVSPSDCSCFVYEFNCIYWHDNGAVFKAYCV
ncbi:unnamed protein product, partial [Rotaria magnacalcarata]